MGYYWICYLGSLIIWLFKGFKGDFTEINDNNIYSFYIGLIVIFITIFIIY